MMNETASPAPPQVESSPPLTQADRAESSTPLNFDHWNGEVAIPIRDIDEINVDLLEDEPTPASTISSGRKRSSDPPTVSRRKKKPKGMPKRPLSAYNLFFQEERVKVLESTEQQDQRPRFEELGRIIAKRWKMLTEEDHKKYEVLAQEDSVRYRQEMEVYNETKRKRKEEKAAKGEKERLFLRSDVIQTSFGAPPEIKPFNTQFPVMARFPGAFPPITNVPSFSQHYQPEGWHPSQQVARPVPLSGSEGVLPRAVTESSGSNNGIDESAKNSDGHPLPPGTEIFLPDPSTGVERKYKVQYKFYIMSRKEAEKYAENLSSSLSSKMQQQDPFESSFGDLPHQRYVELYSCFLSFCFPFRCSDNRLFSFKAEHSTTMTSLIPVVQSDSVLRIHR
jgi:hypothetical protein